MKFWIILIVTLLVCLWASPAMAQENPPLELAQTATKDNAVNIERIAHLGGKSEAIAVQGNLAYLGEGLTLTVMNIEDPSHPILLTELDIGAYPSDIVLAGNYAYVAGGSLHIVDITVPSAPQVVGSYFLPEGSWGWVKNIAIAGQYAYLACEDAGMRVLDISNPAQPIEIGSYDAPDAVAVAVVNNGYVYVAERHPVEGTLHIIDVSNPAQPVQISTFSHRHYPTNIAVNGNYIYMVGHYLGLITIDVSNPVFPTQTHGYATGTGAQSLALLDGGIAVGAFEGLEIFDLSNPAAPEHSSSFPIPRTFYQDIAAAGRNVYLAHDATDLQIFDVSALNQPVQTGAYDALNFPRQIAIAGDYAYVRDGGPNSGQYQSTRIVDISDPATPQLARIIADMEIPTIVQGTYGYATNAVLDISDPISPVVVSSLPGKILGISGNYAYCSGNSGVYVVDISDPTAPAIVATLPDISGDAAALSGGYLYIDEWLKLHIIDVSDPANPAEVITHDVQGLDNEIAISGNYLYRLEQYEGLHILDISDPLQPTELSFHALDGNPTDITIKDQLLYIASKGGGVYVVDVADPENPKNVGLFPACSAASLVLDQGHIIVACEFGGMEIREYTGRAPAGITLTGPATAVQWGPPTTFTTTIYPSTAELPLTRTWQSSAHPPIARVTGLSDTYAFAWDVSDPQAITLTTDNAWGTVTATHAITITPSTPVMTGIASTTLFTHPHGLTLTLQFPAAAADTFYVAYFPLSPITPPAGLGYAGHAFDLKVYRDYSELPDFVFEQPVPLTLRYNDADIAPLDDERELALYRWDAGIEQWVEAACGAIQQDTAANLLTSPICSSGRFALLGRIRLLKRVDPQGMLSPGEQLTYTLTISDTPGAQFHLYDALPAGLDWLGFSEHPTTVEYADHAVSGTLTLPASQPVTISFVTRVSPSNRQAYLTNHACIVPTGQTFQLDLCRWSRPVTNTVSLPMMWRTEVIESRKQFTFQDHGMHLDAEGYPHYAYGGDALYYAHFDGTAWHVTTVDPGPGTGSAASLALDGYGYPHISYYDTTHAILKYAYWDGDAWHIETVTRTEENVSLTGLTSLALDTQNHPHIIFYQGGFMRGMKYAHKSSDGWGIQMLSEVGKTASLVLDGEGRPHIAWGGISLWGEFRSDSGLSYVYWTGSEWVSENIVTDLGGSSTYYVSLQLDQNEVPHLAYTANNPNALRYVHKENDAWVYQDIDTDGYINAVSLTLDAENHPHIAYSTSSQEGLSTVNYVHWINASWEALTLTQTTSRVTGVAIALDENRTPHLGYLAGFTLQYTHGPTWDTHTLDQGGDIGTFANLAFDNEGTAHVTYDDSANNILKLARQSGTAWTQQIVDLTGEAGSFSDLELDADGYPHLSYILTAPRTLFPTLVYARWTGSEWLTQTVDTRGVDVQAETALALDSHGYPHILYYIPTNPLHRNELCYAYWDGTVWHIEVVDHDYDLDGLDLVLDVYDRPHISYKTQSVYYSMRTWEGWHRFTVAEEPSYSLSIAGVSIALDSRQDPHIVYGTGQGARYAYLNTGTNTWIHEEINAEYSYDLDLVVDSSGVPHVVNQTRNNIYYMDRTRHGWSTHSPILATDELGYPSLALDAQGFPHLVYHSANDLNYAVGIPPAARITMPAMTSQR